MWLVFTRMGGRLTILVAMISVALASIMAIRGYEVDIFLQLGRLRSTSAPGYGGHGSIAEWRVFSPRYYEYHFLYITGSSNVESKTSRHSAPEAGVPSDTRHEPGDGEVVGYVIPCARVHASRPRSHPSHAVRRRQRAGRAARVLELDASVRGDAELRLNRVRPIFATLPGVSAPPPFGAVSAPSSFGSIPEKLRTVPPLPGRKSSTPSTGATPCCVRNVRTGI